MKILYSPTSPYVAKVCMAATYCGLPFETVPTNVMSDPELLIGNNPLGKVPTLIDDDGTVIYDSRAIMQYLDRKSGRKLYPRNAVKRTEAERLEALCDGTLDCLLAIRMEMTSRPAEFIYQPWIDRQWSKVERALDHLNANLPRTSKNLHGGHFALAGMVGYLGLRFDGQWERGRPKLKHWPDRLSRFFPDYQKLKPMA
jgi:glutathione S-transferase